MPTRILIRLSLLAGLVAPLCAFALGVGPLEVRSALNQNLEAEIPLISSNPVELIGLTARVPRQQDFDWAGIERYDFFSKLRFLVQTPPGGPNVLKISSTEPIREPNFTLLLELTWPRGRLLREFPIQLDPALYADRRLPPPPPQPVVVAPPIEAPPAAAPPEPGLPPAPAVSFEGASPYGPVRSGETLTGIASRVRPSTRIKLPEMMSILLAGNPEAFVNGNPNALRAGAMLKVPTPQALGVQGAPTPSIPDQATLVSASPESASTQLEPIPAAPVPIESVSTTQPVLPVTSPVPESAPPPVTESTPPSVVESSSPPVAESSSPSVTESSSPSVTESSSPSVTESSSPPVAESTPPPVAGTDSPPLLPVPTEPLREIVPQASIPQAQPEPEPVRPELPPPPVAQPEPPPPSVAQPEPPPVQAPLAVKPPPPPPEQSDFGWLANPVLWVAMALIVLALLAMVLLPFLRRPAKSKQPPADMEASLATATPESSPEPDVSEIRTRISELRSARPRSAVADSNDSVSPTPKPIGELLKEIGTGLSDDMAADQPDSSQARKPETPPLPDTEPPTASVIRATVNPFEEKEKEKEKEHAPKKPSARSQVDLPSELRLDNLDFDFGDLGLENTARPKPDLPPLELKPGKLDATVELPSLTMTPTVTFEPATEPPATPRQIEPLSMPPATPRQIEPPSMPPAMPPQIEPPSSPPPSQKFEFADITQDLPKTDMSIEPLTLDQDLSEVGDQTLDLGKMEAGDPLSAESPGISADYVETKLDLATAYLDMGDQVGARSLLEEVLQEGSDTQQQQARELLRKVS